MTAALYKRLLGSQHGSLLHDCTDTLLLRGTWILGMHWVAASGSAEVCGYASKVMELVVTKGCATALLHPVSWPACVEQAAVFELQGSCNLHFQVRF